MTSDLYWNTMRGDPSLFPDELPTEHCMQHCTGTEWQPEITILQ